MRKIFAIMIVLIFVKITFVFTASFSQVWQIAANANEESNPQLIKDGQGKIWCFWQELHEDTGIVHGRYFHGGAWSNTMSFVKDLSMRYTVAVDMHGRIFLGLQQTLSPFDTQFRLFRIDSSTATLIDSFQAGGAFGLNPKIVFYDSVQMIFFLGGDSHGYQVIEWRFALYVNQMRDTISSTGCGTGGVFCDYYLDPLYYGFSNNDHYNFMMFYSGQCHSGTYFRRNYLFTDFGVRCGMEGKIWGCSPIVFLYSSDNDIVRSYKFIDSIKSYSEIRQWILNFKPQLISTNDNNVSIAGVEGHYPHRQLKIKKVVDSIWYSTTTMNLDSIEVGGAHVFQSILSEDSTYVWLTSISPANDIYVFRMLQSNIIDTLLTDVARENSGFSLFPEKITLNQNFPNPFNSETIISFYIPENKFVTIKIYDILGRQVRTLLKAKMTPGWHQSSFNASDLVSGVYLYRLESQYQSVTRKMLIIR